MSEIRAKFPEKLACLFQPSRYKVLYGGRGAAKSWGVARALLIQGWEKPLRVLCTREIQNSIQDSVHKLLSDQVDALGYGGFYDVQKATIIGRNGTEFMFTGLREQDVAKIKSYEGVDRVWVEEAQVVTKRSWEVLVPTIRKEGSEIWVTFNPELDTDETYQRFVVDPPAEAIVVNVNWRDNPWFPKPLQAERESLQKRDPEAYDNVWEGKPRTVVEGAIYKSEVIALYEQKRVTNVPYDPLLKVHTVWDLGWNDAMTIIMVQRAPTEMRVIDYIEDSHRLLSDYVHELSTRRYVWANDWLPHDARTKDHKYGKSTEEILRGLGRRPLITPQLSVEDGIKSARMLLPKCYFDKGKTQRLLNCLKRYRRVVNINTHEPGAPLHDEYSHGADAFRYLAIVADRLKNEDLMTRKLEYSNAGIV